MKKEFPSYIFNDREIGKVEILKFAGLRKMKITVKPFNQTLVSIPDYISYNKALGFIEEKRRWIRKSQLKLSNREKHLTIFRENTNFSTIDHRLMLGLHTKSTILTVIKENIIHIQYPDFADISDIRIQKAIRHAIVAAWRLEAEKYLPVRVRMLAEEHKINYGKICIRNNKTRWGSCSRENNISLNLHLIRLPDHLCEYVILHELCHVVYKHHQKSFWHMVDQLTSGKAKLLDKELSKYSPEIW